MSQKKTIQNEETTNLIPSDLRVKKKYAEESIAAISLSVITNILIGPRNLKNKPY